MTTTSTAAMKTCSRCVLPQPVAEFSRDSRNRDGLQSHCKVCNQTYRDANRADCQARERAYRDANRDAIQARERAYRDANRADCQARERTYHETHREARQDSSRAYAQAHPEVRWASHYRERAKQAGFAPIVQEFTLADVVDLHGDQCAYCGGPFEHLDHAVPVAKGGPHTLKNVRPACGPCNRAKAGRTPDEWLSTIQSCTTN